MIFILVIITIIIIIIISINIFIKLIIMRNNILNDENLGVFALKHLKYNSQKVHFTKRNIFANNAHLYFQIQIQNNAPNVSTISCILAYCIKSDKNFLVLSHE